MNIENGQTKDKIIILLKKNDGLTTGELSRHVGITPMGIRQHLLALERKNLIRYEMKKNGIGRPAFVYRLTELADDVFPKGGLRTSVSTISGIPLQAILGKGVSIFIRSQNCLDTRISG
ncbi:MAG: winged helix-turn-helix transcriptional regulator [Nitrospiraceae bacterium]|nr:winged helix-turn-helix transcriptional regulator [Nitrospiraceae bacterium]